MGEFAIKVSPFGGSTVGALWERRRLSCGRGWYEPILVGGLTYIGQPADLYRLLSPPCGRVVVQAVSIIDRAIAKSYHDKTEEGGCGPVLVTDVTSTGN